MDHRSQPKCNWTRRAASRLSLSLITNYNKGQLKLSKLYSKQCLFYYLWQKNLLIHENTRWKAYSVSSFPRMLTETNNVCSSTRFSKRYKSIPSPKLQNIYCHHSPPYYSNFPYYHIMHHLPALQVFSDIGTIECIIYLPIPIIKPQLNMPKINATPLDFLPSLTHKHISSL